MYWETCNCLPFQRNQVSSLLNNLLVIAAKKEKLESYPVKFWMLQLYKTITI